MSDGVDYLHAYAASAIYRARRMPVGKLKRLQRAVGRIYLLLTKEAAVAPNTDYLEGADWKRLLFSARGRTNVVSACEDAAAFHETKLDREPTWSANRTPAHAVARGVSRLSHKFWSSATC